MKPTIITSQEPWNTDDLKEWTEWAATIPSKDLMAPATRLENAGMIALDESVHAGNNCNDPEERFSAALNQTAIEQH